MPCPQCSVDRGETCCTSCGSKRDHDTPHVNAVSSLTTEDIATLEQAELQQLTKQREMSTIGNTTELVDLPTASTASPGELFSELDKQALAREDETESKQKVLEDTDLIECSQCSQFKTRAQYANAQLKKRLGTARCRECTSGKTSGNPPQAPVHSVGATADAELVPRLPPKGGWKELPSYLQIIKLCHARDWHACVPAVTTALQELPDDEKRLKARCYLVLARALQNTKALEPAVIEINKAIVTDPAWPDAYVTKSKILIDLKRYSDAAVSYEGACVAMADKIRGSKAPELDEVKEAEYAAEAAFWHLQAQQQNHHLAQNAVTTAQRFTVAAPENARGWEILGFSFGKLERWEDAVAAYQRIKDETVAHRVRSALEHAKDNRPPTTRDNVIILGFSILSQTNQQRRFLSSPELHCAQPPFGASWADVPFEGRMKGHLVRLSRGFRFEWSTATGQVKYFCDDNVQDQDVFIPATIFCDARDNSLSPDKSNINDLVLVAKLALACQQRGARSVVIQLWEQKKHDGYILWLVPKYVPFTLTDWAKSFSVADKWHSESCAPIREDVEQHLKIPVLTVRYEVGKVIHENIRSRITLKITTKPTKHHGAVFVNGSKMDLPLLSSELTKAFEDFPVPLASVTAILGLFDQHDAWRLDTSAICRILDLRIRSEDSVLFLLLLVHVGELELLQERIFNDTREQLELPELIAGLLRRWIDKYIKTYSWFERTHVYKNQLLSPELAKLCDFLRHVLEVQQLADSLLDVGQLLPMVQLYATLQGHEANGPTDKMRRRLMLNMLKRQVTGGIEEKKVLIQQLAKAVQDVQRHMGQDKFSELDYEVLVEACHKHILHFADLKILFQIGNFAPLPFCAKRALQWHVRTRLEQVNTAGQLERLWREFHQNFDTEHPKTFAEPAAVRIANCFRAEELLRWYSSSTWEELRQHTGNHFQVFQIASAANGRLLDYVGAFAKFISTADSAATETGANVFNDLLISYMRSGTRVELWCEVLQLLSLQTLLPVQMETVLSVLRSEAASCFGLELGAKVKSARCVKVRIMKLVMSPGLERALEIATVKLLEGVEVNTKALGLLAMPVTDRTLLSIPVLTLMTCCAQRFGNRKKLFGASQDLKSLVKSLEHWQVSNPRNCMLYEWFDLLQSLQRAEECYGESARGVCGDVVKRFQHFKTECKAVLSPESIEHASFEILQRLQPKKIVTLYEMMERKMCLATSAFKSIQACFDVWQTSFSSVQKELSLLDGAQAYVPHLVQALEETACFREARSDAQRKSSAVMLERKAVVQAWVGTFDPPNRRLFEHFVVTASHGAASNRSVLFKWFLDAERGAQPGDVEWRALADFNRSLGAVRGRLTRLLAGSMGFNELVDVGMFLQKDNRRPEDELRLLYAHFPAENKPDVLEGLSTVLELCGLRGPLKRLVLPGTTGEPGTLERFEFTCAHKENDDPHFRELVLLTRNLWDTAETATWTPRDCKATLHRLQQLLCSSPGTRRGTLQGLLCLFEHLADADKVVEFVRRNPAFIKSDGCGYSARFSEKVEDFLSQLGGDDHKILLSFKEVFHWVAVLVSNMGKSFAELMHAIGLSNEIMVQAARPPESQPFVELSTAQSNMDFLGNLFLNGLGGLDAVLGQFKSMEQRCIYEFNLEAVQLTIKYMDTRTHMNVLSHDAVIDFEQRLGFIQHEDKAQVHEIAAYLQQLQRFRRLLVVICELHALGHRNWNSPSKSLVVGDAPEPAPLHMIKDADLDELERTLSAWKCKLDVVSATNEHLCFFSTATAQRMAQLIKSAGDKCYELALLLCPLFPRTRRSFENLVGACAMVHRSLTPDVIHSEWPDLVSVFLSSVTATASRSDSARAVVGTPSTVSLGTGSPVRYVCKPLHSELFKVLLVIFRGSVPAPYEILWCDGDTSQQSLVAFIERAKHKPTRPFVLLQVDLIIPTLQYHLLKLFLTSHDSRNSIGNLYCVETGPCVLRSASCIVPIFYEDEFDGVDFKTELRNLVFADKSIKSGGLECFYGPPGSGKTYQMRKRIKAIEKKDVLCTTCTVSINEAFSISEVVQKLHRFALKAAGNPLLLCFQINLGRFQHSDRAAWDALMQQISKFFFRLLVLHSVDDPTSGATFNVQAGNRLRILVEMPDRAGHLEEPSTASANDLSTMHLFEELPILATLGTKHHAEAMPFDIGPEATHVAKYLKAYEDGTIDVLYGAGGPKDVVFVLDDSGSMSGSPMKTCQRCLLTDIFAGRLHQQDKVGFLLLNRTDLNVPFAECTPAHMDKLRHSVESASPTQQTPLWNVMEVATKMLLQSDRNSKWIVALTDGADNKSSSSAIGTVHSLLRTNAGHNIRVLFITVHLDATYEQTIRETVVRGDGDNIIRADSMHALEKAWVEVGERLTVSEKIELKSEDITPAECECLLQKYMKLQDTHRHWSRLKQTYWIKYLYRRCGILASSEKFNKNQDNAQFGSSTMKIMLHEVELALAERVDWNACNHEQLVYSRAVVEGDAVGSVDYKWSVIATRPDAADPAWQERRKLLRSLQMHVPTADDLTRADRRVLDSYLAYGLGIPLQDAHVEHSTSGDTFDFKIGTLPIIDEKQFVLTLDFVMKMLSMNERIECRVPCIMEGETGVSKTALTRMLFSLKNAPAPALNSQLQATVQDGITTSQSREQAAVELSILRKLADFWGVCDVADDASIWENHAALSLAICQQEPAKVALALVDEIRNDPELDPLLTITRDVLRNCVAAAEVGRPVQKSNPASELPHGAYAVRTQVDGGDACSSEPAGDDAREAEVVPDPMTTTVATGDNMLWAQVCDDVAADVAKLLRWYSSLGTTGQSRATDWTFYPVDVHAALTPQQIASDPTFGIARVVQRAQRLSAVAELLDSERHRLTTLCIFYDEINTSGCMGSFKELVIDHSVDGTPLPENIVIVAACNPARGKLTLAGDQRQELGNEWAIGHYQVHPLPTSMQQLVWDYGALNPAQEKEFIQKRLLFMNAGDSIMSADQAKSFADIIFASQETTREFAMEHIAASIAAKQQDAIDPAVLRARASSLVSLRDILRVFKLFTFFSTSDTAKLFLRGYHAADERVHVSMLLAVAVVYYMHLGVDSSDVDGDFRRKFSSRLKGVCGTHAADVDSVLVPALTALMDETVLEAGIAKTRGLQENVFMVVVCCLAQVPLMIVGPPGSSKTLAVTIVDDNAKGEYSKHEFYRGAPSLLPFRYQCSRQSSSNEIKVVFERAIARQAKANRDGTKCLCFVFMDEAGLPEEGRESLKVLHYYLEDHMTVDARVGFVAITNHQLDAAKSNRCALLTRVKPDLDELLNVALGCLGSEDERQQMSSSVPGWDRRKKEITLKLNVPKSDLFQDGLLSLLCETYDSCMVERPRPSDPLQVSPPADFVLYFGLRDFMNFMKLLGRLARTENHGMITSRIITDALQRSMNGVEPHRVKEIIKYFMMPFRSDGTWDHRNPLDLLRETLDEQADSEVCIRPPFITRPVARKHPNDILPHPHTRMVATRTTSHVLKWERDNI